MRVEQASSAANGREQGKAGPRDPLSPRKRLTDELIRGAVSGSLSGTAVIVLLGFVIELVTSFLNARSLLAASGSLRITPKELAEILIQEKQIEATRIMEAASGAAVVAGIVGAIGGGLCISRFSESRPLVKWTVFWATAVGAVGLVTAFIVEEGSVTSEGLRLCLAALIVGMVFGAIYAGILRSLNSVFISAWGRALLGGLIGAQCGIFFWPTDFVFVSPFDWMVWGGIVGAPVFGGLLFLYQPQKLEKR